MSNKRKLDHETSEKIGNSNKKAKSNKELVIEKLNSEYKSIIEVLSSLKTGSEVSDKVDKALDFLKLSFPTEFHDDLPTIIHLHQIYAMVPSRTQVDREIERLRSQGRLFLFKFDSSTLNGSHGETLICFADSYKEYIQNRMKAQSPVQRMFIQSTFLNQILVDESHQFSIDKSTLTYKYNLSESQISTLVQNGLITIKDSSKFWFSIPGIGEFRRKLIESRKSMIDILRRQAYKEMNLRYFFDYLNVTKNKSFRLVSKFGASYVLCDVIGNDLVTTVDSPMGLTIKLN